mgnify:FL=1
MIVILKASKRGVLRDSQITMKQLNNADIVLTVIFRYFHLEWNRLETVLDFRKIFQLHSICCECIVNNKIIKITNEKETAVLLFVDEGIQRDEYIGTCTFSKQSRNLIR